MNNLMEKAPVVTVPQRAVVDVESSRSVAEVQTMLVMAKRFPGILLPPWIKY